MEKMTSTERFREALLVIANSDGWLQTPAPVCESYEEAWLGCVNEAVKALREEASE